MRPTPVPPKRADFASFDDYFDRMIQYHLELMQQNPEQDQAQARFIQPIKSPRLKVRKRAIIEHYYSGSVQRPGEKQAWFQQLQQFVHEHQQ